MMNKAPSKLKYSNITVTNLIEQSVAQLITNQPDTIILSMTVSRLSIRYIAI